MSTRKFNTALWQIVLIIYKEAFVMPIILLNFTLNADSRGVIISLDFVYVQSPEKDEIYERKKK